MLLSLQLLLARLVSGMSEEQQVSNHLSMQWHIRNILRYITQYCKL